MKKIFLLFIILFGLQAELYSQEVVKNVGDFTTVRVFDKIPVKLIQSSESKVEITGAKRDDVQVINKNGDLKIRMTALKLLNGDDVQVKVYYKDINNIQASEGAEITGTNTIETGLLYLNVKEGAVINIEADVQKISAKANSGGIINISGVTENQDIIITSGGKYFGEKLNSKQAAATTNAGGIIEITVSDAVEARTRAGGRIDIYGKPENVNKKTLAGGNITVK